MIETEKKIEVERLKTLATYTACYVWGKDPEEHESEVQGIDKPVSEKAISAFY